MSDLPRSNSLVDLAARIKAEHEAAFGHARQALQHAAECGRLLIEAKAQVEHGQWLSWIDTNTGVSARQCQKYMRLAGVWAEIGSKCELDSHLSIEGALGLLAAPAKKPSKALARENPVNVRGIVEVRTAQPSNPITAAWDEASDAQRLEFVRDRAEHLERVAGAGCACAPRNSVQSTDIEEAFKEWYRIIRGMLHARAALKAYKQALSRGATVEQLKLGAMRYAAECTDQDPQYTKHPATWLNGIGWEDEPAPAASSRNQHERLAAAIAWLRLHGAAHDHRTDQVSRRTLKPDRALSDAVDTLLTGDKDRDGRCILAFEPDTSLRSRLQIRLMELQAALLPARPADLAPAVAQMLLGFGSARGSEDAEAIVAQYVTALAHLPLWAVQQACLHFARGSVTKAECPDWKPAYAPSTAQLCRLAEGLVYELWREERRITDVLNGIPRYRPSKEERERVSRGLEELRERVRPKKRAAAAKQPLQPIGKSVSPALEQAMRERDELEKWRAGRESEWHDPR